MLLAGLLLILLILLSSTTQDNYSRGGTNPQGAVPLHINHSSRTFPRDRPPGQSDGGILSVRIPSSQVTRVCIKLARKEPAHLWKTFITKPFTDKEDGLPTSVLL